MCRRAGITRQNYYARRRQRRKLAIDEGLILERVRQHRRLQPRLGVRKLLWLLQDELREDGVWVGRDRLFEILGRAGLLVARKRARARTTNSRHSLPVFRNLLAGSQIRGPNQAWVSDVTYVRTGEGYVYASLITDAYSRKIVGAYIGDSLEAEGCLQALAQALKELPAGRHPIHHSDRGCQYCCHAYVERLQARGLPVSMTELRHCYENAMAERVNGILKQEYEMDREFRTKQQARAAFHQAVWLYNHRRPHTGLNYRFPAEVHKEAA